MFDLEDYKTFVLQQVRTKAVYKKTDVTEKLLEALFQFEIAPGAYLKGIITPTALSEKYAIIFDLTKKKSSSIRLNDWFLDRFGYKHCYKCNQTKILDSYNVDNTRTDKLHSYCRSCDNKGSKAYYIANPENKKEYRVANPGKHTAYAAKYRAAKLQATPTWLTPEQHKQILEFYTKAKQLEAAMGIKHHVDHIVPLQGLNVCGLHVPWNLQILTAEENIRKSNKWQS